MGMATVESDTDSGTDSDSDSYGDTETDSDSYSDTVYAQAHDKMPVKGSEQSRCTTVLRHSPQCATVGSCTSKRSRDKVLAQKQLKMRLTAAVDAALATYRTHTHTVATSGVCRDAGLFGHQDEG